MRHVSALFLAGLAALASASTTCSADNKCPESAPCCYSGVCGVGTSCLGSCDPLMSYSLDSCTPEPICKNQTYSWSNLDDTVAYDQYLGNSSQYEWSWSGYPKVENGSLMLTMPNQTTGSLMTLNHYIWYGKVSAKIKSSRGGGVITGFILMSDVKDEIDFEFVGYNLSSVQTDFYFQGVENYTNEVNAAVSTGNTYNTWHTYTIDWTPEQLEWQVDGVTMRTLTKNSTYNATSGIYMYPQTPSRLQMSLWPSGLSSEGEGTIEWGGGLVDWNSADMEEYGYYYALYKDITIECYNPPAGTTVDGDVSYVYTSDTGLSDQILVSGNSTVLYNLEDTGLNMTAGKQTTATTSSNGTSESSSGSSTSTSFSEGTTSSSVASSSSYVQGSSLAALSAAILFSFF
ncbi:uncharacterized protein BO66DRAFT_421528 [Aspergillus aculeatinus CBS 121060]|uniref:Uncharacterized protein n=1 Tax=Aspergillus aculeatinus CBS 121060 TaxID=1448322 RepID=A0ACD1H4S0_9EURO|nr:hypothetical protein BO66DRAFT_421528 [Aspergillus aculeatinus CBS 121060]RAH68454.1 hypothetical protein BO66DRAFT_421528 [Aspergillus aculeatinus CBS 121060]